MLPPTKPRGQAPPGTQFADHIDQQDPSGVRQMLAASGDFPGAGSSDRLRRCQGKPDLIEQLGDVVKPLGMAGDQIESRVSGDPYRIWRNTLHGDFFFRILSAAGQEHKIGFGHLPERAKSRGGGVLAIGDRAVEFHRAGDMDRLRAGAEFSKPLGIDLILDSDQVDAARNRRSPGDGCGDSRDSSFHSGDH